MTKLWDKLLEGGYMVKMVNLLTTSSDRKKLLLRDSEKVYEVLLANKFLSAIRLKEKEKGVPFSERQTSLNSNQKKTVLMSCQEVPLKKVANLVQTNLASSVVQHAAFLHEELASRGDSLDASARLSLALQSLDEHENRRGVSKLVEGAAEKFRKLSNPYTFNASVSVEAFTREARRAFPSRPVFKQPKYSSSSSSPSSSPSSKNPAVRVSRDELSAAFRREYGYTVQVAPSSVPHPEAGLGLFVRGEALAGSVLALGPGVSYTRTELKHLPNYPHISRNNDHLSCFSLDMRVLDSKPWALGDQGGSGSESWGWTRWAGPLTNAVSLFLDGRHPLALAHYVNHPPRTATPNALLMWVDVPANHPLLDEVPARRSFVPAAHFSHTLMQQEDSIDHMLRPKALRDAEEAKKNAKELVADVCPSVEVLNEAIASRAAEEEKKGHEAGHQSSDSRDARASPRGDDSSSIDSGRNNNSNSNSNSNSNKGGGEASAGGDSVKISGSSDASVAASSSSKDSDLDLTRMQLNLYAAEMMSPPQGAIRVQVLVALKNIHDGEEIFQDYRLNPAALRPKWYVSHNPEDEEMRWG